MVWNCCIVDWNAIKYFVVISLCRLIALVQVCVTKLCTIEFQLKTFNSAVNKKEKWNILMSNPQMRRLFSRWCIVWLPAMRCSLGMMIMCKTKLHLMSPSKYEVWGVVLFNLTDFSNRQIIDTSSYHRLIDYYGGKIIGSGC